MTDKMPKFDRKAPQTKEEKLISELANDLTATMRGFINLNKFTTFDKELFIVLRDGALAYAGGTMEMLANMLMDKTQVPEFTAEAHDIFNCYLKQVRESCGQS